MNVCIPRLIMPQNMTRLPYEETKLEGIFVKDVVFDMRDVYSGSRGNNVKRELDFIKEWRDEENSIYTDVKNHPQFIALFEKYEPYAKDSKETN